MTRPPTLPGTLPAATRRRRPLAAGAPTRGKIRPAARATCRRAAITAIPLWAPGRSPAAPVGVTASPRRLHAGAAPGCPGHVALSPTPQREART